MFFVHSVHCTHIYIYSSKYTIIFATLNWFAYIFNLTKRCCIRLQLIDMDIGQLMPWKDISATQSYDLIEHSQCQGSIAWKWLNGCLPMQHNMSVRTYPSHIDLILAPHSGWPVNYKRPMILHCESCSFCLWRNYACVVIIEYLDIRYRFVGISTNPACLYK